MESSGSESYPEEDEEDDDTLDKKMTQMAWVCKHCAQVTGAQTMFAQLVFRVPPGNALQRARQVSNQIVSERCSSCTSLSNQLCTVAVFAPCS